MNRINSFCMHLNEALPKRFPAVATNYTNLEQQKRCSYNAVRQNVTFPISVSIFWALRGNGQSISM